MRLDGQGETMMATTDDGVAQTEQTLLGYAAEYSFRGRMDQLNFTGPILERGSGSVVTDVNGKDYLDFNSGQMCAALGHNNPKIVDAIKESCETLIHASSSILNTKEIELAKRLGGLVPAPLKKSLFLGSGSDSNETAITIAKKYTGGYEVAAPHVNFSGLSHGTRTVTFAGWHGGYGPPPPGIFAMVAPYCYRCPLGLSYPSCDIACLKTSMELLDAQSTGNLAAVITEPLFSAGGVIEPPKGWLVRLAEAVHEREMLLILDEAQTGLGKLGTMFACEQEGVVPDIMTISKHFGGGIEISAVITTPEIEEKVASAGIVVGHSHTNDPLACNAALASLDMIVSEDLPGKARVIGDRFKGHLEELAQRYDVIGDVRGRGLIQGIEFVRDRMHKEPFFALGRAVYDRCLEAGLLFSVRRKGSVLRFVPPFTSTPEQLDRAAEILNTAISGALDDVTRAAH
jgi:2,2-dialkylglycine decarboxylase (pyruvate)